MMMFGRVGKGRETLVYIYERDIHSVECDTMCPFYEGVTTMMGGSLIGLVIDMFSYGQSGYGSGSTEDNTMIL